MNFLDHTDVIGTLSHLHDCDVRDPDSDRGVDTFKALRHKDMLRVQKLEDDVVIVEVIELGEQLVSYLTNAILREGLAKVGQTVKVLVALFEKGAHYEESFVRIEGIEEGLHDLGVKLCDLIDLLLHSFNTAVRNFDALDEFFNYFGATFATISPPQAQIALIKSAISIRYQLLDLVTSNELLDACL